MSCCGQNMTKLVANSTDAAQEKHVPVIKKEANKIVVEVGSVAHPMTAEHFIEWIALEANGRLEVVHLKPGDKPRAEFATLEGDGAAVTAYAYCNLHGLWKAEL